MTTATTTRPVNATTTRTANPADPLDVLVGLEAETWADGNQHSGTIQRVTDQAITLTDSETGGTITTGPEHIQIDDLTGLVAALLSAGSLPLLAGVRVQDFANSMSGTLVGVDGNRASVRHEDGEVVTLPVGAVCVELDDLLARRAKLLSKDNGGATGHLADAIAAVRAVDAAKRAVGALCGEGDDWNEADQAMLDASCALKRYLGDVAAGEVDRD